MRIPLSDSTWGHASEVWDYNPSQYEDEEYEPSYLDIFKNMATSDIRLADGGEVPEPNPSAAAEMQKGATESGFQFWKNLMNASKPSPPPELKDEYGIRKAPGVDKMANGGLVKNRYADQSYNTFGAADGGIVPDPSSDIDPQSAVAAQGWKQALSSALSDRPSRGDEIQLSDSPLDYIPYTKLTSLVSGAAKNALSHETENVLVNPLLKKYQAGKLGVGEYADFMNGLEPKVASPPVEDYTHSAEYINFLKSQGIDPIKAMYPEEAQTEIKRAAALHGNEPTAINIDRNSAPSANDESLEKLKTLLNLRRQR
jgi:hypothetical protein